MTPELQIDSIRQVFNDGNHNAFTDLVEFQGDLYLTFRNCPEGHMLFTSSRIIVLRCEYDGTLSAAALVDAENWKEVCSFGVPDRDVRDPHFLVFDDKLFVYSGTWWVEPGTSTERDINDHLGYCMWSENGQDWEGPRLLNGTHGHYIWRTGTRNGVAYIDGRRVGNFAVITEREARDEALESWLLRSDNGFDWTPVGMIQDAYGSESALLFEPDGSALAVSRAAGRRNAQVCRAQPPYTEWTRTDLDRNVGGPLLARWGDHYLVGGRKTIGDASPVTTLYWLIDDQLHEIAELPSGGDNSYPGFVALSPQEGLLSYYSSHEGSGTSLAPSAIYLATLQLMAGG